MCVFVCMSVYSKTIAYKGRNFIELLGGGGYHVDLGQVSFFVRTWCTLLKLTQCTLLCGLGLFHI